MSVDGSLGQDFFRLLSEPRPGFFMDWCLPLQTALCFLGARAVTIGSPPPKAKAPASKGMRHGVLRIAFFVLLLMTFSYVFLFQLLGIMEISAVAPFAVIRQHGGSNHLFMPTSLLQQWESTSHLDKFGGGIVRVTACTSDYMNAMYPSNCTDALPERVVAILREGGSYRTAIRPNSKPNAWAGNPSQDTTLAAIKRRSVSFIHSAGSATSEDGGRGTCDEGEVHSGI